MPMLINKLVNGFSFAWDILYSSLLKPLFVRFMDKTEKEEKVNGTDE